MRITFLVGAILLTLSAIAQVGDYPKFLTSLIAAGIGYAAFLLMNERKQ